MVNKDEISDLIGAIYDTALAPSLWKDVLAKISLFSGGVAASILVKDFVTPSRSFKYKIAAFSERSHLYHRSVESPDPWQSDFPHMSAAHAYKSEAPPLRGARHVSAFYQECGAPRNLNDNILCVLDRSSESYACIRVFHRPGTDFANRVVLRRLRILIPHLQRALAVAKACSARTSEVETFMRMLDSFAPGVFLIDGGGGVIHANAAAHHMVDDKGPVSVVGGRLTLNELGGTKNFPTLIATMLAGTSQSNATIPLHQCGVSHYVAHVIPLFNGTRRSLGEIYAAIAAVIVQQASLDISSTAQAVMTQIFNLTPSEVRVMLGIVDVGGVPETAKALGTSQPTVNKHLQHIFAKTGTRRQAELVKLAASFSNVPIR